MYGRARAYLLLATNLKINLGFSNMQNKFFGNMGNETAFLVVVLCLSFATWWEATIQKEIKDLWAKIESRHEQESRGARFDKEPTVDMVTRLSELQASQIKWQGRILALKERHKILKPKVERELGEAS